MRTLPIGYQVAMMRRYFPDFAYRRGETAWYGHLQPTPESPRYRVKLKYVPGGVPRVWVLRPALVPEAEAQHRYDDGSLCLYFPADGDWHPGRSLATTVVPWAARWLFCYECWLLDPDRVWRGPEAPHSETKARPRRERSRRGAGRKG